MLDWTPTAIYHALAAALQFVLGLLIIVRRPRVEWAFVLGALFVLNGALSVVSLLVAVGSLAPLNVEAFLHNEYLATDSLSFIFDRATTILILYLALAYPRRPAILAQRRWVLPVVFCAAILLVWSFVFLDQPMFEPFPAGFVHDESCPEATCQDGTWRIHLAGDLLSVGFVALMFRWARLFPRVTSPLELSQFKLLFAALAMRATNVGLLYNVETIPGFLRNDYRFVAYDGWNLFPPLFAIASLGTIAYTVAHLLRQRGHAGTSMRRAIDFVLFFMLLGAFEYLLTVGLDGYHKPNFGAVILLSPLANLDFQVVRPALVLYAMVRYNLFGAPAEREARLAAGLVALFVFAPFLQAFEMAFSLAVAQDGLRLALSALAAAAVAIPAALIAHRYLQPRAMGALGTVPSYVAALEDAHRNGAPGIAQRATLDELRQRLGVSDEQAQALEEAVRTRWATQARRDWRPGDRILGRYEVQKLLGEGGVGQAFLAHDALTEQAVVLKRTRHLDPSAHKTILQESYALSRLDHPNIVRLLRTEVVGEEPVLVLEHLAGGSLATRLADEGPLSEPQALAVIQDVLAGLAEAHRAGVIHRDLKPSNVLFDAAGRAKLCDFGLARPVAPSTSLGNPTASSPIPLGTVRYMAPEQVQGLTPTAATDLHAVGLLLYECLAGTPAVSRDLNDFAMRRHIVDGPRPAPDPDWSPAVRDAVGRALQRDPVQRFPSAGAFRSALASGP